MSPQTPIPPQFSNVDIDNVVGGKLIITPALPNQGACFVWVGVYLIVSTNIPHNSYSTLADKINTRKDSCNI